MNKETTLIREFILKNKSEKLCELRDKYRNSRDFQTMLGYLIMDIVSKEKKFFNMKRNNIDLPELTKEWF